MKQIRKTDETDQRIDGADISPDGKTRIDELINIIDLCSAAQNVAERIGDKFLVYMLSMAIQQARTTMRQEGPIEPPLP